MDSSDLHPDISALDWHADWDMYLYWYLVASENASLFPPEVSEFSLPSPSPTGELYPTFPSGTPQDTSSQVAGQNCLPPLPDVPGPSSSQPRTTAMPLENDARNRDACYNEGTRAKLRITDYTHPPVDLPIIQRPARSLPLTATLPFNWIKVPQRDYDHGRKQRGFKRLEPVTFSVGGRPGINLGDALRKKFKGLDSWDDPVLQDASGAISCRFMFPGYPTNGRSYQINTLNWTRKRQPITRRKLAYEVAKRLEQYLFDMARFALDGLVENRWKIGQGLMRIDSMVLVRLVSVSKGSFQPEICVVDPSLPDSPLP